MNGNNRRTFIKSAGLFCLVPFFSAKSNSNFPELSPENLAIAISIPFETRERRILRLLSKEIKVDPNKNFTFALGVASKDDDEEIVDIILDICKDYNIIIIHNIQLHNYPEYNMIYITILA